MSPTATVPTDRELLWASIIIGERGKIHMFGRRPTLTVNSTVKGDRATRLQTLFGGKVYAFGTSQMRWQIDGEDLRSCLLKLDPLFEADGKALAGQIAALETAFRPPTEEAIAPAKLDAFNLLESVDEDQLEAVRNEWDTLPKDAFCNAVLRARSIDHVMTWSNTLERFGFTFDVDPRQLLILVHPKESNARS